MNHRHDMKLTYRVPGSLDFTFVCECGLSTADNNQALRWNNQTKPAPPIVPLGVTDAEQRRIKKIDWADAERRHAEKIGLHAFLYGAESERLKDILDNIPPMTRWQRFRQWCRDYISSLIED